MSFYSLGLFWLLATETNCNWLVQKENPFIYKTLEHIWAIHKPERRHTRIRALGYSARDSDTRVLLSLYDDCLYLAFQWRHSLLLAALGSYPPVLETSENILILGKDYNWPFLDHMPTVNPITEMIGWRPEIPTFQPCSQGTKFFFPP